MKLNPERLGRGYSIGGRKRCRGVSNTSLYYLLLNQTSRARTLHRLKTWNRMSRKSTLFISAALLSVPMNSASIPKRMTMPFPAHPRRHCQAARSSAYDLHCWRDSLTWCRCELDGRQVQEWETEKRGSRTPRRAARASSTCQTARPERTVPRRVGGREPRACGSTLQMFRARCGRNSLQTCRGARGKETSQ